MGHTHTRILMHLVFAAKNRYSVFTPEIRKELHPYLGGIAINLKAKPLAINGTDDHVHVLVDMPAKLAVSELVMKLKANSSRWLKDRFKIAFEWQEGYGAFSVSPANITAARTYIESQEEHHRKRTFAEELAWFLKSYGVENER